MTFWDFFEIVLVHVQRHVDLPGEWPFGVFGRDTTEALIQHGAASAVFYTEAGGVRIIVRLPHGGVEVSHSELSPEAAAQIGDEIGKLFHGAPRG